MEIRDLALSDLTAHLREGTRFVFLRYGDGEWNAIFGKPGCNCDGHPYEPVREALAKTIEDRPDYWMGMQPLAWRQRGPKIEAWLKKRQADGLNWYWSEVLTRASIHGRLGELFESLRGREVHLVGPTYLFAIQKHVTLAHHYPVPQHKAHEVIDGAVESMEEIASDGAVVLLCAGLSAEIIAHRLAQRRPDLTIIDAGSVFEPYVGISSRTYHNKILERLAA